MYNINTEETVMSTKNSHGCDLRNGKDKRKVQGQMDIEK